MSIKIFIADDHQLIIDGLQEMLASEKDIEVIGAAINGNEAVEKMPIVRPDIVLLDLDMPGKNGFDVLAHLKDQGYKFIILSMHLEKALLEKAIRLGVDGYLPKTVNKSELILAIQKVANGQKHFSSDVTVGLATSGVETSPFILNDLSVRETEILKELTLGKSSREISEQLHISHFTVETHRKNIMRKLDAHNVADLIRIAYKSGLIS